LPGAAEVVTLASMSHTFLLAVLSVVAIVVGVVAIVRPAKFLESKGATVNQAAVIWMREVGVLIFAQGITCVLLRHQPLTGAVRAFLVGAAVTQFGLLPIELAGYWRGSLTKLSGVLPNSILHAVLGAMLLYRALA
jgi:hypothetical protein